MRRLLYIQTFLGLVLFILSFWTSPRVLYAQTASVTPESCNFVQNLQVAINKCSDINNNWACYGNYDATITPSELRFDLLGDRHPLSKVKTLDTTDSTGIVMLYLNERGMGDPVVAMLYGGVVLKPMGPHEFNLSLTNKNVQCGQVSGMFVQTEEGKQGRVAVNGVQIKLGSTAFITVGNNGKTFIVNVHGRVQLTITTPTQTIVLPPLAPGEAIGIERDSNGQPTGVVDGPRLVATFNFPYNPTIAQQIASANGGLGEIHNFNRSVDSDVPLTHITELGPSQQITLPIQTNRVLSDRESTACGGRIQLGDLVLSELHDSGQECLYTFCGNAGDPISIAMNAESGVKLDPWVDVRGPDNEFWIYRNDINDINRNSLMCKHSLPQTGCYTIVARSAQNSSEGQFRLALGRGSTCQEPDPQCQIVAHDGLHVRKGADLNSDVELTLPADARIKPRSRSVDGNWIEVEALDSKKSGWVNASRQYLICETPIADLPLGIAEPPLEDGTVQAAGKPIQPADQCLGLKCEPLPPDDHPDTSKEPQPGSHSSHSPSKEDPFGTP